MIIASFPKGSFPEYTWPVYTWFSAPSGANIQYTEVYALTLAAAVSTAFSLALVTGVDFAVTMPQVITMATYAELST